MARDKRKDDQMFNCSQQHERDYVAGLYDLAHRPSVRNVLSEGCANNAIRNSTHYKVYEYIRQRLGYPIPV